MYTETLVLEEAVCVCLCAVRNVRMSLRPPGRVDSLKTTSIVNVPPKNNRMNAILELGFRAVAIDPSVDTGPKQRRDAAYMEAIRKAKAAKTEFTLYESENWADTLLRDPYLHLDYRSDKDFRKLAPYTQMLVYSNNYVPSLTESTQVKFAALVCGQLINEITYGKANPTGRPSDEEEAMVLGLYKQTLRRVMEQEEEDFGGRPVTDGDVTRNMLFTDANFLLENPDYMEYKLYVTVGHYLSQKGGLMRYHEAVKAMFDFFDDNNKNNVYESPRNPMYKNGAWRGLNDLSSDMSHMHRFLAPTLAVLDLYVGKTAVDLM